MWGDEKQKENNNQFRRTEKVYANYLQRGVMNEPIYSMEF